MEPQQSFWKVHGKTGVTDIAYHNGHVYTAGRDGHYRQYSVEEGKLSLLHSNKVGMSCMYTAHTITSMYAQRVETAKSYTLLRYTQLVEMGSTGSTVCRRES